MASHLLSWINYRTSQLPTKIKSQEMSKCEPNPEKVSPAIKPPSPPTAAQSQSSGVGLLISIYETSWRHVLESIATDWWFPQKKIKTERTHPDLGHVLPTRSECFGSAESLCHSDCCSTPLLSLEVGALPLPGFKDFENSLKGIIMYVYIYYILYTLYVKYSNMMSQCKRAFTLSILLGQVS